jgi:glycosyltransferase involved in cell wall biosynthesis
MPAVSVLMPVFNGERHLAAAIDSILAQTFRDFELIIVDDGSTDDSRSIVTRYRDSRFRLIALERNAGLSMALNRGLAEVASPLVARQDADDLAEPNRLERQVREMQVRPDVALLGSRAIAMDEGGHATGVVWRPVTPASVLWYSLVDNPFIHTAIMFRTSVVRDECGGFDPRYDPFSQDWALWCRVMEGHGYANLPETLVRYRVRASSIIGSLEKPAQDGYRARFAGIVQEIIAAQVARVFGDEMSETDRRQLAGFALGVEPSDVPHFLRVFERLLNGFLRRHPEAFNEDFRQTLARQFDALAYRIAPPSRLAAARVYARAVGRYPQLVTHLPWARAAGLVIAGKAARGSVGAWMRRR